MAPSVFISYSQRDEAWRDELVRHLRVLERAGALKIWDTSQIEAGTEWSHAITERLDQADLAVVLISPDSLASDFIVEKELPALIRRQRAGKIVVLPVLLKASPWTLIEGLAELQFANSPSKPLAQLAAPEREAAFSEIAERIGLLARAVSQQKAGKEANEDPRLITDPYSEGRQIYFISHAREDGDFAELVKMNLEHLGYGGWIDTDRLLPGVDWRQEIDDTIRTAKAVIAVMSPDARASEYVTYEWAFAWDAAKRSYRSWFAKRLFTLDSPRCNIWTSLTGSADHGKDFIRPL